MHTDLPWAKVIFKFHDYISLLAELVILVMEGSGPSADVACECTQTYLPLHQANFKCHECIFLLVQLVRQEQQNF